MKCFGLKISGGTISKRIDKLKKLEDIAQEAIEDKSYEFSTAVDHVLASCLEYEFKT